MNESIFQKHYIALSLLFLLLLRILIFGASIGDSLAFLSLSVFTGYSLYLQNRNRDIEQSQQEKILKLEELYTETKNLLQKELVDKTTYLNNELNALKQQVGIMKIDNGFHSMVKPTLNNRIDNGEKKKYF